MRKVKFLAFFVSFIFIITFIAGCGLMEESENQDYNGNDQYNNDNGNNTDNSDNAEGEQTRVVPRTVNPRTVVPSPNTNDNGTNINNNLTNNDNNEDYTERVRDIAQRVAQLEEIDSAACAITGDTALVGVQFDEQYKGGVTENIKEKVEDVCKDEDKKIKNVIVSADPDVLSRIKDILEDIGEGRPVSGFAEEINELVNRIQPK